MIGEYSDKDFIKKLTTEEQRQYLITLTEKMTNKHGIWLWLQMKQEQKLYIIM